MRWGLPWWIGHGSPLDGIQVAADHGFDLLEISLDAPWPEELSSPELREAAQAAGVSLGFHGPWRTQALAHPRPTLARAAATVAQACLDRALGAGAEYLVLHVDARDFARYPLEGVVEDGLEHAVSALDELSSRAGDEAAVLVENTGPPTGTPEQLFDLLEEVPRIGFCFDPGHAALAEVYEVPGASADPRDWLELLGDRLTLLHAMDHARIDGQVIDHLVPGSGDADLAALMGATRKAGCETVLVEAFYDGPEHDEARPADLARGREHLKSFL